MKPSGHDDSPRKTTGEAAVPELVDHLFRRESARMVAALTRALGASHLDLAEEVVQEALVKALQIWPSQGIPLDPVGWLLTVARNRALDLLRRERALRERETLVRDALALRAAAAVDPSDSVLAGQVADDELRLVFLCCHPDLPPDQRVALTLKVACGFGVDEIARALLAHPATVSQWLVRARRRIREHGIRFDEPAGRDLDERLDSVLEVCYLLFNEGYAAHGGENLVREELTREALRLAEFLACSPLSDRPAVHALLSLMLFHAARLPARVDTRGELVLLADQDRSLWDRGLIARAFREIERASVGDRISVYHHQAAIAACHTAAPSEAETDWRAILAHYDALSETSPSAIIALNRAVVVAQVRGPEVALEELRHIEADPSLAAYYLLPATRGELLARTGDREGAAASFEAALKCTCSEPERRFLHERLRMTEARR